VGLCFCFALLFLLGALNPDFRLNNLMAAAMMGLLAIPVSAVYSCHEGWPRNTMAAIAIALALAGITASVIVGFVHPPSRTSLSTLGGVLTVVCFFGTFVS